ncbi:Amino acid/amide ABC transporter substrate-binding protein, HAAT family [Halomicronema hongdechloris C2206]|uniref:Amino acid/amide ABC transporter substrate-binding protein, HAAT family n=1 Tax=Halomicronema hongdechloris C2206 TaxID=1641165 RepID=A0A1Z3HRW2_9CYAN|nr:ABC transporter substrate-binding protein [Halomicronema hongdechloris]ASC73050.1 Amino acid/amide ABC transporter substrate-binding protein, HAAT family [Halomicronema hongdechloris C2206]
MSQRKNEAPALILALITTAALLGGMTWWLNKQGFLGGVLPGSPAPTAQSDQAASAIPVPQRLSTGQRILVVNQSSPQKLAGVDAIASENYDQAVKQLEASLQANRNDPEALIYLNNARIGQGDSFTLAVAVPAATAVDPAQEILRGVAQAQATLNQTGGVNGTPIKVMIVSDDNSPEVAAEVAPALTEHSDILGVVGHFGSATTLAASEVYEAEGVPVISPTSTSVSISGAGDYVFRTVPSDSFTATTLSRYLVGDLGRQNAVIYFNAESDYSKSLKEEFTTALYSDGGQVLAEYDLAAPDFSAGNTLESAIQQGAEVIVLASNTATLDQALQVVAVNRQRLAMLGGDSVYNPKTLQVGGEAAVGMVVAVPWMLLSTPNSDFVTTSRQLWGGDVNWRTAMAYDATLALAAALEQAPSREGVQQALSAPSFQVEGATGPIRFLPSGDRNQAMQLGDRRTWFPLWLWL